MPQAIFAITGKPLSTVKHTCGNTAQSLDDVTGFVFHDTTSKKNIIGCLITVETNDIRFAFTAAPTVDSGTALGHVLTSGQSLKLSGSKQIREFKFVNKTSGSNAVLQITAESGEV